jgi:hypothetical protein
MDYTSIKVGQLPTGEISGGNFIPHEVAGVLKKATFTDLAAFIGANDAVGFRAVSVQNGGTLPTTDTQEFILVGPGTYNNVGGGSTITVTEELNALVSNGTYWFVGVEIPIDAPPGNAIWGQIIGTLSNQTDLKNILDLKADLVDGKVPASQLPSYVDDIIEVANFAALPATGETGKIYLTLDNNKIYRWSGSIYIEIAAENAVWGQIVGTLSNQTDLQSALNAKVPYTGATANVDLGTHTLSSKNLVVNHASGSGVAAQITKGGNGEALTVSKSSGTGNAASILGGVTLLSELHLNTDLADAYIASAATWNAKQNALNGTGFVKISGTTISYDNSTYALDSAVVKLTGDQTIDGLKTFSSKVNAPIFELQPNNTIGNIDNYIGQTMATNDTWRIYGNTVASDQGEMVFELGDNAVPHASNGQRFRFFYNNTADGTAKSPFILDYNDATFNTNAYFTGSLTAVDNIQTDGLANKYLKSTGFISNQLGRLSDFGGSDAGFYVITGGGIQFVGGGANRMTLTSDGNVGIGNTGSTPGYKLQVSGLQRIIGSSTVLNFGELDSNNNYFQSLGTDNATAKGIVFFGSSEYMRITSGGDVLVGRTDAGAGNAGAKISTNGFIEAVVNNDICFSANRKNATGTLFIFQYQNVTRGSISTDGTTTSYNITSDYRLKEDFKDYNGLDLISQIKTYDYKWKESENRMFGVIAHELQEIVPYAVTGQKDAKEMQSVDYSKLVPILVQAIQELKAEIEILKTK